MKIWGVVMITTGVAIALLSLLMTTTISTAPGGDLAEFGGREIYNMGLIQRQLMVFLAGLALTIAGVVTAAAGAVIDALRPVSVAEPAISPAVPTESGVAVVAEEAGRVVEPNVDKAFIWAAVAIGVMVIFIIIVAALLQGPERTTPASDAAKLTNISEEMTMTDTENGSDSTGNLDIPAR